MNTTVEEGDLMPAPADVRAALDRMLDSEPFRGSAQLAAFLRFVVEAVLRGERDRIKGYTIAVEALGRDEKFDPQLDPIVRVEATRLRRTLERYYAGPGADEPIIITLERGSYVPLIRPNPATEQPFPASAQRPTSVASGLARRLIAGALVSLLAVAVGAWLLVDQKADTIIVGSASKAAPSTPPVAPRLTIGDGMPTISVEPLEVIGAAGPRPAVTAALPEKLRDAFARFETVQVVSDAARNADAADTPKALKLPVNYSLSGTLEYQQDGAAGLSFRLVDRADGTVIWSQSFKGLDGKRDPALIEEGIVQELAATLVQPFGVIRSREWVKQLASNAGDGRARCIVLTSESFRSFDPAENEHARGCLETLTAADPSFAQGFAYLAGLYVREYQFGLGTQASDDQLLDAALKAARRAVELQPQSARAYHILFVALFARGEMAAAFAAADKAVSLNKYDMTILSDYGGRLITTGEIDRGMGMLERAAQFGTVRPSWHHFYLFLGSYLRGDLQQAAYQASQITSDTYPLGWLARALAAHASNDAERARLALQRLAALRAAWRTDTRRELARHFPSREIVDRLARDLAAAGLNVVN